MENFPMFLVAWKSFLSKSEQSRRKDAFSKTQTGNGRMNVPCWGLVNLNLIRDIRNLAGLHNLPSLSTLNGATTLETLAHARQRPPFVHGLSRHRFHTAKPNKQCSQQATDHNGIHLTWRRLGSRGGNSTLGPCLPIAVDWSMRRTRFAV